MKTGPFQLIKFSEKLYGLKQNDELIISNKFQIGGYAIDRLGADPKEVCHALAEFNKESTNYAEFGVNGSCLFTQAQEVDEYYDLLPIRRKGVA